jgi:integrase
VNLRNLLRIDFGEPVISEQPVYLLLDIRELCIAEAHQELERGESLHQLPASFQQFGLGRTVTIILIQTVAQRRELRKSDSKYKRLFSPSTVNRYLQVLSRILSMAYENGIVDSNPMSRVKRLREPEPRQRYLNQFSDDEEERLMKALKGYGEHVVALAELDLEVGMRLGELLNARWADMDEFNRLISIIKTKNDKPRLVPLTKKALGILKRLRQDAPEDELIFDPQRTGRKRRQLMVCFEQAVEESGSAISTFMTSGTPSPQGLGRRTFTSTTSPTFWATRRRRARPEALRSRAATRTASRKD